MKFEYKQIVFTPGIMKGLADEAFNSDIEVKLNELGADGWELVRCFDVSVSTALIYVFKRQVD